jgi:hypothetical protein
LWSGYPEYACSSGGDMPMFDDDRSFDGAFRFDCSMDDVKIIDSCISQIGCF